MKPISILALTIVFIVAKASVPTAIFHGFGDSCYFPGMYEFT